MGLLLGACQSDSLISSKAQFKIDTTSIGSFLQQQGIAATKIQEGMWFIIDSAALGVYPVPSDSVTFSYTAQLIPSLSLIDSATETELLSTIIAGWQLGLARFPSGSKGRLFVPSGLAFGTSAHRGIPPNSNLIYNVKSFRVVPVTGDHLATDMQTIAGYISSISDSLVAKKIKVVNDGSDILYALVDSAATLGNKPTLDDSVQVTYNVRYLKADTIFYTATSKLLLKDQNTSWKITLPKIREGYQFTMYVPSGYAYGNLATSLGGVKIPANSNLQYQIILTKVY
ncbi:MAG: FKBP-type peptidyl-prolyl cis-trans isomerase [Bacteroidetes bacterium]|nr:FKBP-type peptidyl-prolyl cis-trans isomerase [Bacteroidota bacterium]